jgi:hypothetical protein
VWVEAPDLEEDVDTRGRGDRETERKKADHKEAQPSHFFFTIILYMQITWRGDRLIQERRLHDARSSQLCSHFL